MTLIVVDVETTGLGHCGYPKRQDGVVQMGMAWRDPVGIQRWSSYCNPGEEYFIGGRADEAFRINGLSVEHVQKAKPAHHIAKAFWDKVKQIDPTEKKACFKSYNRKFDQPFLDAEPWNIPDERWGDCIMLDAAAKLNARWLKLQKAAASFQIPWPDGKAHDAAVDAHAALLIHEKMHGEGEMAVSNP